MIAHVVDRMVGNALTYAYLTAQRCPGTHSMTSFLGITSEILQELSFSSLYSG
jgi:hypothetical protein